MKRFFIIAIAVLPIVAFTSCNNNGRLKTIVQEMKEQCPLDMGEWAILDDVDYFENVVTMTYTVDDGLMDFDNIRANEEAIRNNVLIGYANNSNEGLKMLLNAIVKADAGLCLVYNSTSGEHYEMRFTADELKLNKPTSDADKDVYLKTIVDNTRLQLPMDVEEGMVMTDVYFDREYLTYVYLCDEMLYDMDILKENLALVRSEIVEALMTEDALLVQTLELLRATNRGIIYRYVGNISGKTCSVCVEHDEL